MANLVQDVYLASTLTTGRLSVGGQTAGALSFSTDIDWFGVDLVAGTTYEFSSTSALSGDTQSNLYLSIYGSTGLYISGTGASNKITYSPTVSGRYYLSAESQSGATGTYTLGLLSNDPSSMPTISLSGNSVNEGSSGTTPLTYTAFLSQAATTAVTFTARTTGGTATSGSDYTAVNQTFTIAAGATRATITVNVAGDTQLEPDETLILTLSQVSGATLAGNATSISAIALIINDELPALSISSSTLREGDAGSGKLIYTATLSQASTSAVTFLARTTGGTATSGSDYTGLNQTVTIAAGQRTASFDVIVTGDARTEAHETVSVTISQVTGAALAGNASSINATGTILNDDFNASFSVAAYRALNPDLAAVFGENKAALAQHFISYGKAEGRTASGFDAEAYAAKNPDLFNAFGMNTQALTNHYINFGKSEGRVASGFDALAYAALNPDLFAVFGTNKTALVTHYIQNGRAEGRQSAGFDTEAYAALNPDLYRAFGLNTDLLISHYVNNGRAEGRRAVGFDSEAYAALNPDLLLAFGFSAESLINHYINAGRAEGRMAYTLDSVAATSPLDLIGIPVG